MVRWIAHRLPLVVVIASALAFSALMAVYVPLRGVDAVYDVQRFTAVVLCALGLFCTAGIARTGQSLWLLALLGAMVIAFAFRPSIHAAALLLGWVGLLGMACCAFRAQRQDAGLVRNIWLLAALAMVLVYFVRTTSALYAGLHVEALFLSDLFLGFANVRNFAQLVPMLLPLLALGALPNGAPDQRLRVLYAIGLTGWCALLWLNGSAGVFYSSLIGVLVGLVVGGVRRAGGLSLAVVLGLVGGFLLVSLLEFLLPVLDHIKRSTELDESGRLHIWQQTLAVLKEGWWLGMGAGEFSTHVNVRPATPHNALLGIAFDFGVISLVLMLVVLWSWFSPFRIASAVRGMSPELSRWPLALTMAAYGAFAHSQVSGINVTPLAQLLLAITLGLLLGACREATPVYVFPRATRVAGAIVAVALIAVTVLSYQKGCEVTKGREACKNAPSLWHYSYPYYD